MTTNRLKREQRYAEKLRQQDAAAAEVRAGRLTVPEAARRYGVPEFVLLELITERRPTNGVDAV